MATSPSSLALSFVVTANTAAAARQVSQLQQQLQGLSGVTVSNPTAPLTQGLNQSNRAAADLKSTLAGLASGAVVAASFLGVVKQAIAFESAVGDVRKVVDGTGEQINGLTESMVKLSRSIPLTQTGLLEIASAAGQMGIALKDIPAFVELTAKSATAFGLLPREAGDAFASLSSIFRLSVKELEDLSDVVNTLGNTTAASERSIIDVLTRIGSTGQAIGLTKEELASFASTVLPLVGGQSERASTALNSLFTQLGTISQAEPKARKAFESLGLNVKDFSKALREDASGALGDFFKRLNELSKGKRVEVLAATFGRESADEILSLSGAFTDYEKAVASATDKTQVAGAVNREFGVRVETTEAQLVLAKNALNEVAVNVGTAFLPAIVKAAQGMATLSIALGEFAKANPVLVQSLATMVGAMVALRVAAAALALVLPAVGVAAAGAGAAATVAGAGGLSRMGAAAIALLKHVGSLRVGLIGLIALIPSFLAGMKQVQQYDRAQLGKSLDVADAVGGLNQVRAEIDKLNATYKDDKGSQVYLATLARLTAAEKRAMETVAARSKEQEEAAERARQAALRDGAWDNRTNGMPPPDKPDGPDAPDAEAEAAAKKAAREAKAAAEAYAEAMRAFSEAEIDAVKKVNDALRTEAEAKLEASLQARLVSQRQYLVQKAALDTKAIAEERAALRAQKDLAEKELATETDPAKKKKIETDLVKLKADLTALESRDVVVDVQLKAKFEEFERQVESLRIDIRANILDLEGNPLEGTLARIAQEQKGLLDDPRVKGDAGMEAGVNEQAQLRAQRARFDEQARLIQERADLTSIAEERIALAVQNGQKTALAGEQEVRAARLAQADAILANVAALEALAAANPANMELAISAERARLEYDKLRTTLDETASSINRDLAGSVSGFVQGISEGKSAIDSLGSALSNVFGNLAKRFLKGFEDDLFNALQGKDGQGLGGLLSSFLGGGTFGSLFSGLGGLLGFDKGGFTGPGGRLDPAGIVHKGEFVFDQAAVRRLGLPYLYSLQKGFARPNLPGYSDGGLVGGGMAAAAQRAFSPTIQNDVSVQNAMYLDLDDLAKKLGRSPVMGREVTRVVFVENAGKFS